MNTNNICFLENQKNIGTFRLKKCLFWNYGVCGPHIIVDKYVIIKGKPTLVAQLDAVRLVSRICSNW